MNTETIIAFIIYFALLLTIGLIAHRKDATAAEFIMGGRSLNFWVTALSAQASDMSAWLFMAVPMAIFISGVPQLWIAIGLVIGGFLNWHFVAPKLRKETEKYQSLTLSTFFERRLHDKSGRLRLVSALMLVLFMTHYLSAGLIAIGILFESLFQIEYFIGISIATAVVVTYTFVGGFTTVAWTDLFQAIFLLIMISIVPVVAFFHIDGVEAIKSVAAQKQIALTLLPDNSLSTLLSFISLAVGWGIGYFGMPHVITKFMGIKSASELYKSKYLGVTWQILALLAAAAVGLIGIAYFKEGLANPQMVFVEMVKTLFNPFTAGFILCGVFAANLSTMDSQLLVTASVLTEDFYKGWLGRSHSSSTELLRVSRASIVVVAAIALIIAYQRSASVADTVSYSWSGLGSVFGPLVLTCLYSKTINRHGALAGMIVGGVVSATWPYIGSWFTSYPIMPIIPGFFSNLATIFLVSSFSSSAQPIEQEA